MNRELATLIMRIVVSVVVLGVGIWLVVGKEYQWAYSLIALVVGYWLR